VSSWGELVAALGQVPPEAQGQWLTGRLTSSLQDVARLRGNRNVMLWGSAFLQKSILPGPFISITGEDLNGFMSVIHGMDCTRGLTLIIHTPGGEIGAAETIVSYLRSKFESIEVVVPTFAMSAGTMISLAAERIVMGRQSQLGPIDPQIGVNGRYVSAGAIVAQYEQAVLDVVGAADRDIKGNLEMAHIWAPILATLGPALLVEARYTLDYGEKMVAGWLATGMFKMSDDRDTKSAAVARYFGSAAEHKYHGRRIGRDEARGRGLEIEDLETSQDLQDAVLTAYHVMTILFDNGPQVKLLTTDGGALWIKNVQFGQLPGGTQPVPPASFPTEEPPEPPSE
jgi:hypothetical protein